MRVARRDGALVVAAAAVAGGIVGVVDAPAAGLVTAALLGAVGLPAIVVAHALSVRRARLGSLRRQLGVGGALAVGQLLIVAAVFAAAMFVSAHDALLLTLVAAFCALVATLAGAAVVRRVLDDVDALRSGLDAVAGGRRDVRVTVYGADELAALAASANTMVAQLAEQENARRGMVAAVSHDLRTPITSLRLLVDALADDIIAPGERRAALGRIDVHLRALGSLVDDLFELARLEAGDVTWAMQRVSLGAVLNETAEALRTQAQAGARSPGTRQCRSTPLACADPGRLQRVLVNLVQNAIRHTPADGAVTVLAEPVDGRLEVEVADAGPGIALADRPHVFDAFFQGGERAARSDGGAGLGLAIARAIVEAHGGEIWLAPAASGTRVRFSLALA